MWMISSESDFVEEFENFLTYTLENCENVSRFWILWILNFFIFLVVSDVGGLLGLFLGCSLLSIVEIFFFLLASFSKFIRKRCGKKTYRFLTNEDLMMVFSRFDARVQEHLERNDESIRKIFGRIEKLERNLLERKPKGKPIAKIT